MRSNKRIILLDTRIKSNSDEEYNTLYLRKNIEVDEFTRLLCNIEPELNVGHIKGANCMLCNEYLGNYQLYFSEVARYLLNREMEFNSPAVYCDIIVYLNNKGMYVDSHVGMNIVTYEVRVPRQQVIEERWLECADMEYDGLKQFTRSPRSVVRKMLGV